jgi:hypothetical protein
VPKPSPIALVVCDAIYQDGSAGKAALVGLFNLILAAKFPAVHPQMCVYVAVTDVHRGTHFRLTVVDVESDEKVVEMQGPSPEKINPTNICEFRFILKSVVFPRPGRYDIQFWGNDHLLLQRPFEAKLIESAGGKP